VELNSIFIVHESAALFAISQLKRLEAAIDDNFLKCLTFYLINRSVLCRILLVLQLSSLKYFDDPNHGNDRKYCPKR